MQARKATPAPEPPANQSYFMKYRKDFAIVATVVLLLLWVVLGEVWADAARRPFWWHFWAIGRWVALVIIVGGWVYSWVNQSNRSVSA